MVAWRLALEERNAPHALILTRQGLPLQARDEDRLQEIERGGYVLHEPENAAQAVIMATGSEVKLAVEAASRLAEEGVPVRVVSMPNPDRFRAQDANWRDAVLPPSLRARVAVEAGVSLYWQGMVGDGGRVVGIDSFGASAPAGDLFKHFGLTTDAVCAAVRDTLNSD
jgi:transketolase